MSDRRKPTPAGQRGLPLAEGDWILSGDDESDLEAGEAEAHGGLLGKEGLRDLPVGSGVSDEPPLPDESQWGTIAEQLEAAELALHSACVRFRRVADLHLNSPDSGLVTFAWGAGKDRTGAAAVRSAASDLERLEQYARLEREAEAELVIDDRLT